MEQVVTVRQILPDGRAQVACARQSACSGDCHKCAGCGAAAETVTVEADNPIGAGPGDRVVVRSESRTVLKAAAVLYAVPVALFFLGWGLGELAGRLPGLFGGLGFGLGLLLALAYDRRMAKRRSVSYEIIGYAEENEQWRT